MAKTQKSGLLILALIILSACLAVPVKAEPKTITVPDDYATISTAIQHANNGEIIKVRAGNYLEASLTINKSISLIGENKESTILNLDSPSHKETVSIIYQHIWHDPALIVNCNNFKLSGFSITTTGGNIQVNGNRTKITENSIGADISIYGSSIQLSSNRLTAIVNLNGAAFTGQFCNVSANQIVGALFVSGQNNIIASNDITGGLGIYANTSLVRGNSFHDSSSMITISGNYNLIYRNSIDKYGLGPRITGYGNNFFLNNVTRCGMAILPGNGNTIYANYFSKNAWILDTIIGADQNNSQSVLFYNNFVENYNYKIGAPEKTICLFDDGKKGNYWSDYTGTDANDDGIGDTPYNLDSTHIDHYPLIAPFNYSSIPEVIPDQFTEPKVALTYPQNTQYTPDNLPISVVLDSHATEYFYCLDNQEPVAFSGNTAISGLTEGQHSITVYAIDNFGNLISPQTINFTIQATPVVVYAAAIAIIVVACVGCILYVKKKKKN